METGLTHTFNYIKGELEAEKARGVDISQYATSKVVQQTTASLEKIGQTVLSVNK